MSDLDDTDTTATNDDTRAARRAELKHGKEFLEAVIAGDLDEVKALLGPGFDINKHQYDYKGAVDPEYDRCRWRPLHAAIILNHIHVVAFLIAIGANVEARSHRTSYTALYFAAQTTCPDMVSLLLNAGADVDATSTPAQWNVHTTPIQHVLPDRNRLDISETPPIGEDHIKTLILLLDAGANPDGSENTRHGRTGWNSGTLVRQIQGRLSRSHEALITKTKHQIQQAATCGHVSLIKMLLERGATVTPDILYHVVLDKTPSAYRPGALKHRQFDTVKYFVNELGAADPLNVALMVVATSGHETSDVDMEICRVLLGSPHRDLKAGLIYDVLTKVAKKGPVRLLRMLLDSGVDVNGTDKKGRTAVMSASRSDGHMEELSILKLILEHGAGADTTRPRAGQRWALVDNFLHELEYLPTKEALCFFLDMGANTEARNDEGETPLILISLKLSTLPSPTPEDTIEDEKLATMSGVMKLLAEATTAVDAADEDGMTALHHLAVTPYPSALVETLTILLQKGAKLDVPNRNGDTPTSLFRVKNGISLQEFLLRECG